MLQIGRFRGLLQLTNVGGEIQVKRKSTDINSQHEVKQARLYSDSLRVRLKHISTEFKRFTPEYEMHNF